MTPPKSLSFAEDPKKIYVVQEGSYVVAYIRTPGHNNPKRLKSSKIEGVEFVRSFIRQWRQIAIANYYEFDNRTVIGV